MSSIQIDMNDTYSGWERELLRAVRALRFGSVEVTVHDGRVVQIEKREKVRLEADRRRPDARGRDQGKDERADRASGGSAPAKARETQG
jgi:hypothetical protein